VYDIVKYKIFFIAK